MNLVSVAARNIRRNTGRTFLTVLVATAAIVAFVFCRTVIAAWYVGIDAAAKDRIGTRHKVSFILPLPKRYIEDIRNVPGVKVATWANWFGGKDPNDEKNFFFTGAVDGKTFFDVYDEMKVDPDVKQRWLENRRGAILGDLLAKKLGKKPGDKVTLAGTIYPGNWDFEVIGTYEATRKSVDRYQFIFHWDYLNESVKVDRMKDQIGWVVTRVDDPGKSAQISQAIDKMFEDREIQTLTMSEKAMGLSFMAGVSAIFTALDVVSLVILVIMALILGNTIAMGVRERTNEYGVLRAIGFTPRHIAFFILGEAATIGVLGGAFGLAAAYFLLDRVLGRLVIEENLGNVFPYFRVDTLTIALAFVLPVVLAVAASLIPAIGAARLKVTDALRRVA